MSKHLLPVFGRLQLVVAMSFAGFAPLFVAGCNQQLPHSQVQSEKVMFFQENLPEYLVVQDDLMSQINSHQARLYERQRTLRGLGRNFQNDKVYRSWSALLQEMQKDHETLRIVGDEAYLKHQKLVAAGSVSKREISIQQHLIEDALKVAGRIQRKMQGKEEQLRGLQHADEEIDATAESSIELSSTKVETDDNPAAAALPTSRLDHPGQKDIPESNTDVESSQTWVGTITHSGRVFRELAMVVRFTISGEKLAGAMTFPTKPDSSIRIAGTIIDSDLEFRATERVRGARVIAIPCDFKGTLSGSTIAGSWTAISGKRTLRSTFRLERSP